MHINTRKSLPENWDFNVWTEARTITYHVNWGVKNNTETAKAIMHWFIRTVGKTGDKSAMIKMRRQYKLWQTRKWELSKAAEKW